MLSVARCTFHGACCLSNALGVPARTQCIRSSCCASYTPHLAQRVPWHRTRHGSPLHAAWRHAARQDSASDAYLSSASFSSCARAESASSFSSAWMRARYAICCCSPLLRSASCCSLFTCRSYRMLQPAVPCCNVSPLSCSASCRSLVILLPARATPSAELPIPTSRRECPPSVRVGAAARSIARGNGFACMFMRWCSR